MKWRSYFLLLCGFLALLWLNSCSRKTKSFTLTGILADSCTNNPIAEAEINAFSYKGIYRSKVNFGSVNTDANGYFTIPNVNMKQLNLNATALGSNYDLLREYNIEHIARVNDTINIGMIYLEAKNYFGLEVKPKGTYATTDTLYIGSDSKDLVFINPIVDTAFFQETTVSYISPVIPSRSTHKKRLVWGIGKAQFDTYFKGKLPDELKQHEVEVTIGVCAHPAPSTIYLP